MTAFLTAPKHGWWLAAGAVLIAAGLTLQSFARHRERCLDCGFLGSADDVLAHRCPARRAKRTIN